MKQRYAIITIWLLFVLFTTPSKGAGYMLELEWDYYEETDYTGFIVEVWNGFHWSEVGRPEKDTTTYKLPVPLPVGYYKYRLFAYRLEPAVDPDPDPFALEPVPIVALLSPDIEIRSEPSNEVEFNVGALEHFASEDMVDWKKIGTTYYIKEIGETRRFFYSKILPSPQ